MTARGVTERAAEPATADFDREIFERDGHAHAPRGFYARVGSGSEGRGLVERLRRREPGAFHELYRGHRDRIWRFLRQLSGRADFAEDLFQDTWLSAARHAHRLRDDTDLGAWLFTIARNKHRNALRGRVFDARRRAAAEAEPMNDPAAPDGEADVRARARRVTMAFAELPEAYREVLLLCVVEGLDARAIGRILDLREDAVRKRLSRARAELQRLSEGRRPEGGER